MNVSKSGLLLAFSGLRMVAEGHKGHHPARRRILLCGDYVFQPRLLDVLGRIASRYDLDAHVLGPQEILISPVYRRVGKLEADYLIGRFPSAHFHLLPTESKSPGSCAGAITRVVNHLKYINPDLVWCHAEFWEPFVRQLLLLYRLIRRPTIIAYAATNHAGRSRSRVQRLCRRALWGRLDGVAACAGKAAEAARRMGLPRTVPVATCFLPHYQPGSLEVLRSYPWRIPGKIVVGFAGSLTKQKGWRLLLEAVARLPERYHLVVAGDGPERGAFLREAGNKHLGRRLSYLGVLDNQDLLDAFKSLDMLVLPSITTASSVEQFGSVLAEAMGCGIPVIGSTSGAIPETIGDAGMIFQEGDVADLIRAISFLGESPRARREYGERGVRRFRKCYTIEGYSNAIARLLRIAG